MATLKDFNSVLSCWLVEICKEFQVRTYTIMFIQLSVKEEINYSLWNHCKCRSSKWSKKSTWVQREISIWDSVDDCVSFRNYYWLWSRLMIISDGSWIWWPKEFQLGNFERILFVSTYVIKWILFMFCSRHLTQVCAKKIFSKFKWAVLFVQSCGRFTVL